MCKINLSVFLISLFLFSCAAPQEAASTMTALSETATAAVSPTVVPEQTAAPNLVPKHNDLIFVEFFAVT